MPLLWSTITFQEHIPPGENGTLAMASVTSSLFACIVNCGVLWGRVILFMLKKKWRMMTGFLMLFALLCLSCCQAFIPPARKSLKRMILPAMMTPVSQDVLSSCVALGGSVVWLQIWITLAKEGKIDSRLSRKIIHCGSVPLFIFVWPFYSSNDFTSRAIAAAIPLVQMIRWGDLQWSWNMLCINQCCNSIFSHQLSRILIRFLSYWLYQIDFSRHEVWQQWCESCESKWYWGGDGSQCTIKVKLLPSCKSWYTNILKICSSLCRLLLIISNLHLLLRSWVGRARNRKH